MRCKVRLAVCDTVPTAMLKLYRCALGRSQVISCVVPDTRKAVAVRDTLEGPVGTACPASVLRTHPDTVLWLEPGSASLSTAHKVAGAKPSDDTV